MRFPKATREAIVAAKGKPVQIDWPLGEVEPQPGRHYTVQSSHRAAESRILVLFVDDAGEQAIVRVDDDPVRLLGKSGGYSASARGAMSVRKGVEPSPMGGPQFRSEVEPEAVSEEEQMEMSAAARRFDCDRRQQLVAEAEAKLAAVEEDESFASESGRIAYARRVLRRAEERVERRGVA